MSDSPERPERLADILRELVTLSRKTALEQRPESEKTANDLAAEIESQTAAPRPNENSA